MTHYMLAVHSVAGEVREPMTEEAMRRSHERLGAVEEQLKSTGSWVFSGRLHSPTPRRSCGCPVASC